MVGNLGILVALTLANHFDILAWVVLNTRLIQVAKIEWTHMSELRLRCERGLVHSCRARSRQRALILLVEERISTWEQTSFNLRTFWEIITGSASFSLWSFGLASWWWLWELAESLGRLLLLEARPMTNIWFICRVLDLLRRLLLLVGDLSLGRLLLLVEAWFFARKFLQHFLWPVLVAKIYWRTEIWLTLRLLEAFFFLLIDCLQ